MFCFGAFHYFCLQVPLLPVIPIVMMTIPNVELLWCVIVIIITFPSSNLPFLLADNHTYTYGGCLCNRQ